MDRIFSSARTSTAHAVFAPQTYIPVVTDTVTLLVVADVVLIPSTMGALSVTLAPSYSDAPAPRERCIVLGARDNRIYV